MIETVIIKNFQCHDLLKSKVDPRIHVIEGTSDSGKSAQIRALEWVRINRPKGKGFVRHGQDTCSVSIITARGSVRRIRTKEANKYVVTPTDKDSETFSVIDEEAMRRVWDILRLSDINVQRQHDPPFLLSDSPGEIAKRLNTYANLAEIDITRDNLSRGVTVRNKRLESKQETISDLTLELKKFDHIKDTGNKLKHARSKEQEAEKAEADSHSLSTRFIEAIPILKSRIPSISSERLQELQEEISDGLKDFQTIQSERDSLWDAVNAVKLLKIKLEELKDPTSILKLLAKAEKANKIRETLDEEVLRLRQIWSAASIAVREVLVLENEEEALKEKWEEIKGESCPICGQSLEGMK